MGHASEILIFIVVAVVDRDTETDTSVWTPSGRNEMKAKEKDYRGSASIARVCAQPVFVWRS